MTSPGHRSTDRSDPAHISVIIVNWNSKAFLRQCLRSIYCHCHSAAVEVVVVDGGSFDGCAEMLASEFPSVLFVQSMENVGFAKANNLGARHSSRDLLLFLNPDTELFEDSIDILRRHMHSLVDAGIVGCTLLNSDHTVQTSCVQPFPTLVNQVFDSDFLRLRFQQWRLWDMPAVMNRQDKPVEVEAVIGACILIERATFNKVGGFTESYFMYGEDLDLCFKVRQTGRRIYHVAETQIIHHGSGSTPRHLSNFSNVMMRESVYRFLALRSGAASAAAYRAAMGASAVLRILLILPFVFLSRKEGAQQVTDSLRKWFVILRWSLGLESVVNKPV